MKRYKLVRTSDREGVFLSANTPQNPLQYKVGEITEAEGMGIACYKELEFAQKPSHVRETKITFNHDKPVAILEVESMGKQSYKDKRYKKNGVYEGGVNYQGIKVLSVIRIIK